MSTQTYTQSVLMTRFNLENPSENLVIDSPQGLLQYLKAKIPKNPDLINEFSRLISIIYPGLNSFANNRKPDKGKIQSIEQLIDEIENNDGASDPKSDSKFEVWFNEKNSAGFLMMAFALKAHLEEMVAFMSQEFSNFTGNKSLTKQEFSKFETFKFIYQAFFEFYQENESLIYPKLIQFLRKEEELKFMKKAFYRHMIFSKKAAPKELVGILLEKFEDFDLFLHTNFKHLDNQGQIYKWLVDNVLSKTNAKKNVQDLNNDKIITFFAAKCLENGWKSIFRLLVKFKSALMANKQIFHFALANKSLDTLRDFLKNDENARRYLLQEVNFASLLDYFENEDSFIDGIFLLNQIKQESLDIYFQRFLIMKFELLLSSTLKSPISLYRILLSHVNPFSVCCLLSDIFQELSLKNKELRLKFSYLASEFQDLAMKILEKLQNSINLHYLLNKTHFPSEIPILELLLRKKTFFEEILIKPNVYSIINEIWNSPYETQWNILRFSTPYCLVAGKLAINPEFEQKHTSFSMDKSLTASSNMESPVKQSQSNNGSVVALKTMINFGNEGAFYPNRNLFKFMRTARIQTLKINFIYQFKILVKHMGARSFLEFLSFLVAFSVILTILLQNLDMVFMVNQISSKIVRAILNLFVLFSEGNLSKTFETIAENFPLNEKEKFLAFAGQTEKFHDESYVCRLSLYIFDRTMDIKEPELLTEINECKCIYEAFQSYYEKRNSNLIKEALLLLSSFTGFLQVLFFFFKKRRFNISLQHLIDFLIILSTIALIYLTLIDDQKYFAEHFEEFLDDMKIILTALILLLFVRFIFFMRMSNTLGIPLQILYRMMSHLSTIIIMFIIIFLSFTIFMYFLYTKRVEQYYTLFKSIKTIFKYVFGEMAFYKGDSHTIDISYFTVLTLGLGFIRLIFLNILIAILSNIYERIQKRSGLEIALLIHEANQFQDFREKTLSSLIVLPSPFNLISLVFAPFLVFFRSKTLNSCVLKMGYCIMLLSFSGLFLFTHLFIIPVAWIHVLWRILINSYGVNSETSQFPFFVRRAHLIQWIFFGPFYLIYVVLRYDLQNFYQKSFEDAYKDSRSEELSLDEYEILKRIIKAYYFIFREKKVKLSVFWKRFQLMFEMVRENEELANEDIKKSDELLVLMKNNFENLAIKNEIDVGLLMMLIQNLKKIKGKKPDGRVVKYPQFIDLVNLKLVGDTIKLFQYKKQLLK